MTAGAGSRRVSANSVGPNARNVIACHERIGCVMCTGKLRPRKLLVGNIGPPALYQPLYCILYRSLYQHGSPRGGRRAYAPDHWGSPESPHGPMHGITGDLLRVLIALSRESEHVTVEIIDRGKQQVAFAHGTGRGRYCSDGTATLEKRRRPRHSTAAPRAACRFRTACRASNHAHRQCVDVEGCSDDCSRHNDGWPRSA